MLFIRYQMHHHGGIFFASGGKVFVLFVQADLFIEPV